jgi:hypothetical protein
VPNSDTEISSWTGFDVFLSVSPGLLVICQL